MASSGAGEGVDACSFSFLLRWFKLSSQWNFGKFSSTYPPPPQKKKKKKKEEKMKKKRKQMPKKKYKTAHARNSELTFS